MRLREAIDESGGLMLGPKSTKEFAFEIELTSSSYEKEDSEEARFVIVTLATKRSR